MEPVFIRQIVLLSSAIFGLAGFAVLIIGIRRSMVTKDWRRIEGILCDHAWKYDTDMDGRRSDLYAPIYEFFVSGERYTVASNVWDSSKKNSGRAKTVLYNPDNPSDCALPQFAVGEIAGGIFFLVIAAAALFITDFL